jgi:hypothetical protein
MADDPVPGGGGEPTSKGTIDLVIGKSTDKFQLWQQIPAWVLGGAAILGAAALIAFPKHQTTNAWAAVIVGVFLAAMLSYRSAFTLNDDSGSNSPAPTDHNGASPASLDREDTSGAAPAQPSSTARPKAGGTT